MQATGHCWLWCTAWFEAIALPHPRVHSQGKCVVLKTSTRQTIFLPVVGLVDADSLRPGDLVGVNKVSMRD